MEINEHNKSELFYSKTSFTNILLSNTQTLSQHSIEVLYMCVRGRAGGQSEQLIKLLGVVTHISVKTAPT